MAEHDIVITTNEFLKFDDFKIEKIMFYCFKKAIMVNNVKVEKILISNEFAYGKNKETNGKYFIRYKNDDEKIRALVVKLPQMIGYPNEYRKTKYVL